MSRFTVVDEWYPANSTIGPYVMRNYGSKINFSGGTRNQNFRNAVNASMRISSRIAEGGYGEVFKLIDTRFVLKVMFFNESNGSDNLKIFLNEIKVGSTPGIQAVGPKIYAFKITHNLAGKAIKGEYIMDNLGNFKNLKQYARNKNIRYDHPIYKELRNTILKFWKITKGYHGDLHSGNIAVIENPNGSIKVKLIDYGAHKKFKNSNLVSNETKFNNFIKMINKQFNDKYSKAKETIYYPTGSKIKTVLPVRGQALRSNANMLRGINIEGNWITTYFNNSIMNRINPKSNKTKLESIRARRKPGNTHQNLFVHRRLFNMMNYPPGLSNTNSNSN